MWYVLLHRDKGVCTFASDWRTVEVWGHGLNNRNQELSMYFCNAHGVNRVLTVTNLDTS